MTPEELENCLPRLARMVANAILDDQRGHLWIREVVLRTVVELERTRSHGVVRSFLDAVESRGMKIYVTEDGKVKASAALKQCADLRAVFISYRREIVDFLEHVRHVNNMPWRHGAKETPNGSTTTPPGTQQKTADRR